MLENNTNKVVTSLTDNISFVSTFGLQELCGKQRFHPIIGTIKNDSYDTTNPLYDSTITPLHDDKNGSDILRW